MSQANVEQFSQQVAQDSALQEQLKSANSLPLFKAKMVELGKQKGFTFTESDVESFTQAQVAKQTGRAPGEKLTEEELESVGGGITPTIVVLTVAVCNR